MNKMFLSLSKKKGVTLLEVLLVLAIASSILVMIISYSNQKMNQLRMDRTVMQMQQILNAGLAYYVNTGKWPDQLTDLQPQPNGSAYLPASINNNPWGLYSIDVSDKASGVFKVILTANKLPSNDQTNGILTTLAGQLPLASVDTANKTITSQVNIPGQNLNNARSVNFASIYPSGACVPAPKCPGTMAPQIMVVPAAAYGLPVDSSHLTAAPVLDSLTSFIAFARGDTTATNVPANPSPGPGDCAVERAAQATACQVPSTETQGTKYWRVCLSLTTERGVVYPVGGADTEKANYGKKMGSVMALTRCAPSSDQKTVNESPVGTGFNVFTPNVGWDK